MSLDDLRAAVRAYHLADKAVERAETALAGARAIRATKKRFLAEVIAAEALAGTPQKDIVKETGYTRERVRQLTNAMRAGHTTEESQ